MYIYFHSFLREWEYYRSESQRKSLSLIEITVITYMLKNRNRTYQKLKRNTLNSWLQLDFFDISKIRKLKENKKKNKLMVS